MSGLNTENVKRESDINLVLSHDLAAPFRSARFV